MSTVALPSRRSHRYARRRRDVLLGSEPRLSTLERQCKLNRTGQRQSCSARTAALVGQTNLSIV